MARILVVDDEPFIVKMVSSRLKANGYEVVSAYDGASALAAVNEKKPDLLLIDIMMPPPDGLSVCKTLRADDGEVNAVPIILLTAKSSESEIAEAMKCGADDYIVKPYNAEDLLSKIRKYVS